MSAQQRQHRSVARAPRLLIGAGCIVLALEATRHPLAAAPPPGIIRVGLEGADFLAPSGNTESQTVFFNSLAQFQGLANPFPLSGGRVLGTTNRWINDPSRGGDLGFAVPFLFEHGTATRLGLTDFEHRDDFAGSDGSVSAISTNGFVVGTSSRHLGNPESHGTSTWVRTPSGTTTRAGLFDAEHTLEDNFQFSSVRAVNPLGQAIGTSLRLDPIGSPFAGSGSSAWYYNPAVLATTRIGLFNPEHTSPDGVQSSSVRALTDGGRIVGSSVRFGATSDLGTTAWMFDPVTNQTTTLGFTGPGFVSTAGSMQSLAALTTPSGMVAGTSKKYVLPSATPGQAAWFFDGTSTTRLGFFDAPYTDALGRQNADVRAINTAGQVLGFSTRYSSSGASIGAAAWLSSAGTTTRLGLLDAEHTSPTGAQSSSSRTLNNAGHVLGVSTRYRSGPTSVGAGTSVWFFDGAITRRVNPDRPDFIAASGDRFASTIALNQHDQAIGYSQTFTPGTSTSIGIAGWYFDAALAQTTILDITIDSTVRPTFPSLLSDSGLVAGTFNVDRLGPTDPGTRVFLWSAQTGFIDPNRLVPGGLAAAGWEWLSSVSQLDPSGTTLVGIGRPLGWQTDSAVFVLTIPAPVPGAAMLAFALFAQRRRRT